MKTCVGDHRRRSSAFYYFKNNGPPSFRHALLSPFFPCNFSHKTFVDRRIARVDDVTRNLSLRVFNPIRTLFTLSVFFVNAASFARCKTNTQLGESNSKNCKERPQKKKKKKKWTVNLSSEKVEILSQYATLYLSSDWPAAAKGGKECTNI